MNYMRLISFLSISIFSFQLFAANYNGLDADIGEDKPVFPCVLPESGWKAHSMNQISNGLLIAQEKYNGAAETVKAHSGKFKFAGIVATGAALAWIGKKAYDRYYKAPKALNANVEVADTSNKPIEVYRELLEISGEDTAIIQELFVNFMQNLNSEQNMYLIEHDNEEPTLLKIASDMDFIKILSEDQKQELENIVLIYLEQNKTI